ncbi:ATP-binding protein [Roseibium aggregatum]|uniref:ATP-binding protein n=1 Tax=Roseibium aggregatum TaxID=187304 RepID=UPI001A8F790E|nr:ATP-binding protein [Roseibium aggregatum]MBN8179979.1 ATP-binding protein [Roseibium aggregatum]
MKLTFENEYKSIPKGGEIDLPNFVVLSGVNGSGKSHFFEAIQQGSIKVSPPPLQNKIIYIGSSQFSLDTREHADLKRPKRNYHQLMEWIKVVTHHFKDIEDKDEFVNKTPESSEVRNSPLRPALKELLSISYDRGKIPLQFNEIQSVVPTKYAYLDLEIDLFTNEYSQSFLEYLREERTNQFHQYLRQEKGKDIIALTDDQFIELKGPPPWEVANQTLKLLGLPYEFHPPNDPDLGYTALLHHTKTKLTIDFKHLSSGEKTLLFIATAMYHINRENVFPSLLLLDEPDNTLHPKMISTMLEILQNIVLPNTSLGVMVITHNPTTCALSPENSIFVMNPDTRRPEKRTIDEAVSALSVGIPTLSIRKEDERQVVVEANIDADLYSLAWSIVENYSSDLELKGRLNFIPSGPDKKQGNCDRAIHFCQAMRGAGSRTIFALIDRDKSNKTKSPVFVAGDGERYSIENYFLSPILIAGLMMFSLQKRKPSFAAELKAAEFKDLRSEEIQSITNAVCDSLISTYRSIQIDELEKNPENERKKNIIKKIDINDNSTKIIEDIYERKINIPNWYINSQGHALADLILMTFPELNEYAKQKTDELMISVVERVLRHFSSHFPRSLADTLKSLATN